MRSRRKICSNVRLTDVVPAPEEPVTEMIGYFADTSASYFNRHSPDSRRFQPHPASFPLSSQGGAGALGSGPVGFRATAPSFAEGREDRRKAAEVRPLTVSETRRRARPAGEIDKPRLRSSLETRIWPKAGCSRESAMRSRAASGSPGSACGGSSPPKRDRHL